MSLRLWTAFIVALCVFHPAAADDIKRTDVYQADSRGLDAVPAIDTHDHLRPFDEIPGRDMTDRGRGMTLHSVWAGSYYTWINPLSAWPAGHSRSTPGGPRPSTISPMRGRPASIATCCRRSRTCTASISRR